MLAALQTGPSTPESLLAYYSSGYPSLTAFLEKAFSSPECVPYEADPDGVFTNFALNATPALKSDSLPAKERLFQAGIERLADAADPLYIEFGVRSGRSMEVVSRYLTQRGATLFGLDTFTGLPDGWVPVYGNRGRGIGPMRPIGAMAVDKMPDFADRRVVLLKGLFQDTLPLIIPQIGKRRLFVNIDGDTYTAALYGLTMLHPYFKPGDIVYFDEFVDEINEFAAFNDYVRSFYMRDRFKVIGRAYDGFLFQIT